MSPAFPSPADRPNADAASSPNAASDESVFEKLEKAPELLDASPELVGPKRAKSTQSLKSAPRPSDAAAESFDFSQVPEKFARDATLKSTQSPQSAASETLATENADAETFSPASPLPLYYERPDGERVFYRPTPSQPFDVDFPLDADAERDFTADRKSTRLNSSHTS